MTTAPANPDVAIVQAFAPLWSDFRAAKTFPDHRPLLAHYTTMSTLERIVASNEVWFSNPLFMNDLEELRFGLVQGVQEVMNSPMVRDACGTKDRADTFLAAFSAEFNAFNSAVLDVYIFCLSLHDPNNNDGLLSMWRGYGGSGNGAAIVFDTSKLSFIEDAPLVIDTVVYESAAQRIAWIKALVERFAAILNGLDLPNEKLRIAAIIIFNRLKQFALFTKHHGFSEEQEWRVVYFAERDRKKVMEPLRGYMVGPRGIEPKLKLPIAPLPGATASDMSLNKIVHKIILGPTVSSPLAQQAVLRMLEHAGKPELRNRVVASTIPFRSTT